MSNLKLRRYGRERLPITITLDQAMYSFVEDCARQKRFRSVDEFFDAALTIFKNHVDALNAYIELEEAKGRSFEEIMRSSECEIVFTRQRK